MDENDRLREEILAGLQQTGFDATTISREIGRSKDFVRDFLQGRKKSLALDAAQAIRDVLNRAPQRRSEAPPNYRPSPTLLGERDFPLYVAAEGGLGDMVVTSEVYEWVQRPWYMREVKDGYGVLVVGESMDPAFKPGDIAVVNPKLPLAKGRNAIFVSGEERGEFKATIKELQRWDTRMWHVRQHNPPEGDEKEFMLERRTWPKALRVVGKYEGG